MRVSGRRHWTETITVSTVTYTTSGANTGATTVTALHTGVQASVQPASNAEVIRHGLTTDQPVYWVRYAESPPTVGDRVTWRGAAYRVVMVSEGAGVDTQLLMQLDGAS